MRLAVLYRSEHGILQLFRSIWRVLQRAALDVVYLSLIDTSWSCLGDTSLNPLESFSGLRYRSTLIEEDETLIDTLMDATSSDDPIRRHSHTFIRNAYK